MTLPDSKSFLRKGLLETKVAALNPPKAICCSPADSISTAIKAMKSAKVGSLLVVEAQKLSAIVTERDILRFAAKQNPNFLKSTVGEIATSNPETLESNAGVGRALYLMAEYEFRHIPILYKSGELHLLSVRDLLVFMYRELTKKLIDDPLSHVADSNQVDRFFESPLATLEHSMQVFVSPDTDLAQVVSDMVRLEIGAILITKKEDNRRLLGIFSERDLINRVAIEESLPGSMLISDLMSKPVATVLNSSTVALALNKMVEGGFRHLPVVNEYEQLVGILSVKNFIRFISKGILEVLES